MRYMKMFCLCGVLYIPTLAMADVNVEGFNIPSVATVEGQTLVINGAGFRSILFMDIYLVSLYLARPSDDADVILRNSRPAQLRMMFLHGGAGHDMLAKGWRKGFERNQPAKTMHVLEARLQKFSDLFGDVQKGDVFAFDFLSNGDTRINVGGHPQGIIHGADFQRALLAIWLGRNPIEDGLKKALLQQKNIRK